MVARTMPAALKLDLAAGIDGAVRGSFHVRSRYLGTPANE